MVELLLGETLDADASVLPHDDGVPELLKLARHPRAIRRRQERLRAEEGARLEGAPLAVLPPRHVHHDAMGVELRVQLAAALVLELRDDDLARRLPLPVL